jgi:hypothetical protein
MAAATSIAAETPPTLRALPSVIVGIMLVAGVAAAMLLERRQQR